MASLAVVLVMASAFFAAWLVALYLCYATTMASRDSSSTCSSLCFVSSALVSDWASFFAFGFGFGVDFVLRLCLRFSCMCLLMLFAVSIAAAKCVAILSQLLFLGGWGGCLFGH